MEHYTQFVMKVITPYGPASALASPVDAPDPHNARCPALEALSGMNNPNGGGLAGNAPVPSSTPSLPSAGEPLDPEVEELWSSRALLLVRALP